MKKTFKRFAAALLLACLIAGSLSVTSAEAALKKPTKLQFLGWYNNTLTGMYLKWNAVKGADEYEIRLAYTDNSKALYRYTKDSTCYVTGLEGNRVYLVKVRAIKLNSSGGISSRSPWSASIYTIPLPTSVKASSLGKKASGGVKLSWNKINGSNGYRVYLSTNPSGKWYLATTTKSAGSTTAKLKKFNGSSFKKGKNYYYRIMTLRKLSDGSYKAAKLPSSSFSNGYFWWY